MDQPTLFLYLGYFFVFVIYIGLLILVYIIASRSSKMIAEKAEMVWLQKNIEIIDGLGEKLDNLQEKNHRVKNKIEGLLKVAQFDEAGNLQVDSDTGSEIKQKIEEISELVTTLSTKMEAHKEKILPIDEKLSSEEKNKILSNIKCDFEKEYLELSESLDKTLELTNSVENLLQKKKGKLQ